ncbi:hypothetical protein E3T28_07305 [Cryobacterium sinapicolor]|uniref:Transcriptional regulator, AbiEi antitoxin, Type IV TA system n=1 Tax=Cryobacterium sinapicolor TaxID=1259236 RepID=A0ABY2J7I1_9MICO|nr:hypothetical protein [Cryobacterium sinapicolor]TFD00898.1 hypothetical protein E3T28_07305 [Cryobacterium sinapicolor]
MRSLTRDIVDHGLFVKRAALRARGWSDGSLRGAVSRGTIVRVRTGWYSVPSAPQPAVEAFRIGGRLTGLSCLTSYGIWTPATGKLHVSVPSAARGLRRPTDMRARLDVLDGVRCRVTWSDEAIDGRGDCVWRTGVREALVHILNNHDRVTAIVCLDAALHSAQENGVGIVLDDLDWIFARAPLRVQPWRHEVDGRAAAGGETEFRLKALAAGIPFVPQPFVTGVGRLDGQIGPSTFVEIDGKDWHDDSLAFEADRERDLLVASKNGRTLRFSYALLRKQWGLCVRAMVTALEFDYRREPSTAFPHFPERMPRVRRRTG